MTLGPARRDYRGGRVGVWGRTVPAVRPSTCAALRFTT